MEQYIKDHLTISETSELVIEDLGIDEHNNVDFTVIERVISERIYYWDNEEIRYTEIYQIACENIEEFTYYDDYLDVTYVEVLNPRALAIEVDWRNDDERSGWEIAQLLLEKLRDFGLDATIPRAWFSDNTFFFDI